MSEHVRISTAEGVTEIVIARPDKKNALTAAMYNRMIAALDEAAKDDSIGAVIFAGEGGVFTAGNDIGDFLATTKGFTDFAALRFIRALAAFEKPMVAAVDGLAIGVGTTMLFHCDLVYATAASQFQIGRAHV